MKRPFSITIIGVVILLQGVFFTAVAGFVLGNVSAVLFHWLPPDTINTLPTYSQRELLFVVVALVMGICCLVSSVGVLRLRSWAWLMAMIVQGINLAAELVSYLQGTVGYFNMLVSVIIVLYLNQRDVQRAFSVAQHRSDPASTRTAEADRAAVAEAQREVIKSR